MSARISLASLSGEVHRCYICLKTDKSFFFAHSIGGELDHYVHQECQIAWAQEKKRYCCVGCQKPYPKSSIYPLEVDVFESVKLGLISATATTILTGIAAASAIIYFKSELPDPAFLASLGHLWSPLVATNSFIACIIKRCWINEGPPDGGRMNHRAHKALYINKN